MDKDAFYVNICEKRTAKSAENLYVSVFVDEISILNNHNL